MKVSLKAGGSTGEAVMTSGYFPGDDIRIPPKLVTRLLKFCERIALKFLFGCDASAHHEEQERRTEVRKLFNWSKQTGGWPRYKTVLTMCSNAIREAKRNSLKEFCEAIEQTTEAPLYKTIVKELKNYLLKKEDGIFTETEYICF